MIDQYKQLYREHHQTFPQSSKEQLYAAIKAVFKSWNNPRAKVYRNLNDIPHDLGTAVNVQAMVFGNSDQASGTGVVFTRNPASGEHQLFGEFLLNAQGEDVVAGIRTLSLLLHLRRLPQAYAAFQDYAKILENHYKDMQISNLPSKRVNSIFSRLGTVTDRQSIFENRLRSGSEGIISKKEALQRVSPATISQLIHPVFEEKALQDAPFLAQGLPASPGAATGEIVFTAERAKDYHSLGKKVILVRQETSPEDIEGMVVSQAIVTSQGGMTSHAAVVAGEWEPAVWLDVVS